MREKLRSSKGMTLTELLMALLIVSLIGAALTVGVNSAAKVYRDSTQLYEAETLCGTILTYLEDEFRFGRNIRTDGTFDSLAFGNGVGVHVDDGKVYVGTAGDPNAALLSDGAYTSGLKALKAEINYQNPGGRVQIVITVGVGPGGPDNYVEHTVTVVPVNN